MQKAALVKMTSERLLISMADLSLFRAHCLGLPTNLAIFEVR